MARYEIVDAEFAHIGKLCGTLRYDDIAEITCFGIRPFVAIRRSFKASHYRKTAFVEGQIAAMWGLAGVMLSGRGEPWLLTAPAIEKAPISFFKETRREVAKMMETCHTIEGYTSASYVKACRFLEAIGFELDEPTLLNGVSIVRYVMRA